MPFTVLTSVSIGKVFKYLPSVKKKDSKRDEEKKKNYLLITVRFLSRCSV